MLRRQLPAARVDRGDAIRRVLPSLRSSSNLTSLRRASITNVSIIQAVVPARDGCGVADLL